MLIYKTAAGISGQVIVCLYLLLMLPATVEAQKNCTKGIPCGNTCISASKVCRIGSTRTAPTPTYVVPVAITAAAADEPDKWLTQAHGRVYYRASCQAAKELPEPIYFKSQAEAIQLGYRRSQVPGC